MTRHRPLVFTDTSALVAFFSKTDSCHLQAIISLDVIKKHKIKLVISDYVFDETITTILVKGGHRLAVQVGDIILNGHIFEIAEIDATLKKQAWDYFKKHSDKTYSFTDCTSFVLMNDRDIVHYFSFDEDFKRAGFVDFYECYKQ
ncbi:MAG: PIN domain-containing protein [Candidatus Magnetobacterium sp. LHC-1]|uniref:PIN domain-containing protein n=1 Tax=Candidatus Magnetobacterium casense TaxID=1455061 RepID=A0ABS6S0R2_9BACT|nr:PIN domain-containing protein [Candidatus Magnetobacterium casensis]MBF0606503.1 PIN domain-containing protein [Nitrospirota bacterium]MBV6342454.1 PIN domain-containing protein [Candidatus Magnetobacterium casensis]